MYTYSACNLSKIAVAELLIIVENDAGVVIDNVVYPC